MTIEDVPEIWHRSKRSGSRACRPAGTRRETCSAARWRASIADEAFDATPVVDAISDFFTGNREYANLPRKFKLSVTGCLDDCAQAEINDIGMWPARSADGELGFNLLVGGGLSDGPADGDATSTSSSAQDQAVECAGRSRRSSASSATARTAASRGCATSSRSSAPRAFAPSSPTRGVRARAGGHRAHPSLPRRPRRRASPSTTTGLFYVGCSVPVGRISGQELVELADLAEHYGDGGVRLGDRSELRR